MSANSFGVSAGNGVNLSFGGSAVDLSGILPLLQQLEAQRTSQQMGAQLQGYGPRNSAPTSIGMGFQPAQEGAAPSTLGDVNTAWANFYNQEAQYNQSHGLSLESNLDTSMAQKLQSANGPYMYSGFADPNMPVFNPYMPANYNPSYQGVRPAAGGGYPGGAYTPQSAYVPDFIPGFTGGVDGANSYNGSANGGISTGPQIQDWNQGMTPYDPSGVTPFTNDWSGGQAPSGSNQTGAPQQSYAPSGYDPLTGQTIAVQQGLLDGDYGPVAGYSDGGYSGGGY